MIMFEISLSYLETLLSSLKLTAINQEFRPSTPQSFNPQHPLFQPPNPKVSTPQPPNWGLLRAFEIQ